MQNKIVLLQINGGMGKCVLSTAVCKAIKTQYPEYDLVVVSGYPDVFINNKNVAKSFQLGNMSYFYSDYIENKDIKVMLHDPYLEADYIQEKKHLIEIWCQMFGIKYNGETPELFLTQREIDAFQKRYLSDKPIMIMQTNGGFNVDIKYSWARDLTSIAAIKIIEHFSTKYNIVHLRREDQIGYPNTNPIHAPFRELVALIMMSEKRLLIDSFAQHICAALKLPSTVCWIANSPKVLGYDLHDNIQANPFTQKPELRNAYISKFNIGGEFMEYPYQNDNEIFDIDKIIASLENENPKIITDSLQEENLTQYRL